MVLDVYGFVIEQLDFKLDRPFKVFAKAKISQTLNRFFLLQDSSHKNFILENKYGKFEQIVNVFDENELDRTLQSEILQSDLES